MTEQRAVPGKSFLLFVFAGLSLACGYQHGFGTEHLAIRTLAIKTVNNLSFRQDLDRRLTLRLAKDLSQFTGFLPASFAQADAILEVTLVEVSGRGITDAVAGQVAEGAVLLAAKVRLTENGSGRLLYEGKVTDWAEFLSTIGESLADAENEAVADLSRKILSGMAEGL